MAKVERSIAIQCPAEHAFRYVNDPANLPRFIPSMLEVTDIQPLANGGHKFRWVYNMAGMRFDGTSETIECIANQRLAAKFTGGIESVLTFAFRPEAGGTRVTFVGEYKVPVPLLGRLAEAMVVKVNEKEAETMMGNLKTTLES